MLIFWTMAALMVLLALWFVLPPLLQAKEKQSRDEVRSANLSIYQDQNQELEADLKNGLIDEEHYQREKDELERRLLEDVKAASTQSSSNHSSPMTRRFAYGLAAAIPITAVALYFAVGNPKALTPTTPTPTNTTAPANQQGGMMTPQQIEANVGKLSKRLEANANDANLWADYAEALALANGQRVAGKPLEAANRALQLDPKNEKALALAGTAAFQANDYQKAIEYWQRLLPLLPPGSELSKTASDQIAKAKDLAAGRGSR